AAQAPEEDEEKEPEEEEPKEQAILVNLSGYETTDSKIAVFRGEDMNESFEIIDADTKQSVYAGSIIRAVRNTKAGEIDAYGDFSDFDEPGTYYISTQNHGESASFVIEKNHYQKLLDERTQYSMQNRQGGILNAAQLNDCMMQVTDWLLTYEFLTEPSEDSTLPEVISFARQRIELLQSYQDTADGSIHIKDITENTIYYRYAAVFAMFADIYQTFDEAYADTCREQAIAAWNYAEANTEALEPDSCSCDDERYWASAQLYKLTGEKEYRSIAESYVGETIPVGFSDDETGYLGSLAYLTTTNKTELKLSEQIMKAVFDDAIAIVNASAKDGYMIAAGDAYDEDSVLTAFANARLLTFANIISKSVDYVDTAANHLDYLYGRNPYMINYAGDETSAYYNEPETFILTGMLRSYIVAGQ
ncbi:MAG TPA: glycoside hydrolase family 9 protein, partial [Lachnospiraceae bacterium]|nr:glycoside hydrolase family 9 protein [Lachnospiraceae bacterium]